MTAGGSRTWLGSGAAVLAVHGVALVALMLAGVRLPAPPVPEPVVLIELPPLAAPAAAQPQMQAQQAEPQPETIQPQTLAPRVAAPRVNAPLPREVVAVQPPQAQPSRAPAPVQAQPAPQAAPAPQGQGTAEAQGDDPRAAQQEADYRSLVRSYVARNRFSPPQSRREGLSGDIGVRFNVNRSGDISNVAVARSSGHDLLDSEAVEFIRRLGNVPAFPRDLRRSDIPLTITLRFALERR